MDRALQPSPRCLDAGAGPQASPPSPQLQPVKCPGSPIPVPFTFCWWNGNREEDVGGGRGMMHRSLSVSANSLDHDDRVVCYLVIIVVIKWSGTVAGDGGQAPLG